MPSRPFLETIIFRTLVGSLYSALTTVSAIALPVINAEPANPRGYRRVLTIHSRSAQISLCPVSGFDLSIRNKWPARS